MSAGYIRVGRDRIPDFTHLSAPSASTDVIVKSSNVGAILVGLRLGPERLSRYVEPVRLRTRALSRDFPSRERTASCGARMTLNDSRHRVHLRWGTRSRSPRCRWQPRFAAVANGGELLRAPASSGHGRARRRAGWQSERTGHSGAPFRRETAAAVDRHHDGRLPSAARRGVPGCAVTRWPARPERPRSSSTGATRTSGSQRVVRRLRFRPTAPRFVILVMIDTPRTAVINGVRQRAYTGGLVGGPDLPAHRRRRPALPSGVPRIRRTTARPPYW